MLQYQITQYRRNQAHLEHLVYSTSWHIKCEEMSGRRRRENRININFVGHNTKICPCTANELGAHTRAQTYLTAKPRPLPWGFSQGLQAEIRCRRALLAPLESRLAPRSKIQLIPTTQHDPSCTRSLPISMRSAPL